MSEFYTFSWAMHIFIISILGIGALAQTLALLLKFFRYRIDTNQALKNILESLILFEIIIFSLLYGQMLNGYKNGFLLPTGYIKTRIIIFLASLILVLLVFILNKNFFILSLIPAIAISLPIIENVFKGIYPYLFIGTLIFFLIRSIKICTNSIAGIKSDITAFSVPYALDTLHTGVLFSENDGHTILTNHQMHKLMFVFTGKIYRNSKDFYKELVSGEYESRYKKEELDGETVYILNDGTAWIFTKTEISFLKKKYIHISATDVSKLWALTVKLQNQEEKLKHKSEELKKTIANLNTLSKKREIDNAKIRAHDILGQRLTVLLRIIQNESNLDKDLLKSLSKGLLTELNTESNEIQPHDELKSIQQIFTAIGVDINFKGKLPDNEDQARLFVDIIREGSTNAVRHGFATQVNIKSEELEGLYNLEIRNIGHGTSDQITLGSGLKTIRKKVSSQGGKVEINPYPQFTLSIVLPGGDKGV